MVAPPPFKGCVALLGRGRPLRARVRARDRVRVRVRDSLKDRPATGDVPLLPSPYPYS